MSETEKTSEGHLNILGQVVYYPRTMWGTLSIVSVVAGICVIVWVIAAKANPANINAISSAFSIARLASDKIVSLEGSYQIQFWTPSVKTKKAENVFAWEKAVTEETLNNFADHLLKDRRVRGYRRYETTGQGLGARRDGMWWVMTVDDDYEVVDFVKVYKEEFWKKELSNEGSIYFEILRSSAGKHIR